MYFNCFAVSNSRRGNLTAVLAMLLIATLIAYAPVLWNGYPANAWDSRYNAVTGRLFSEQLWSGDLYPRWLIGMNSGLGSPHFFFYAPLGYYIAAAFHWLSASTGLAQLGAAAVLLGFGSGVTCFFWLSRLMPRTAALTGAIFYLASPNHVFFNLFGRADFAEFAAMTFTPIVLLGVELLRERKTAALPLIAGGFAAVVLTHIVVGLLFSGFPLVYALARCRFQHGWARVSVLALVACVIGLALTGFYLVPALAYRPDVNLPIPPNGMATSKFIFGAWDEPINKPIMRQFLAAMFIGYAVLSAALLLAWWRAEPLRRRDLPFPMFFALATMVMLLSTIWTRPLWLLVPILWTLQDTMRLLVIIDLCVAAMIGLCVAAVSKPRTEAALTWASRGVILFVAAAAGAAALYLGLFDYDAALWRERMRYTDDYGLFRPKAAHVPLPADDLPLVYGGTFHPVPLPAKVTVVTGDAGVQVIEWKPRHIVVHIDARTPGRLAIGQLFVAGWRAVDQDSGATIPLMPSDDEGLLTLGFGPGAHNVVVTLVTQPPEYAGAALSVISIAALIALTLGVNRRQGGSGAGIESDARADGSATASHPTAWNEGCI